MATSDVTEMGRFMDRLLRAKDERRRELARLPFPEKIAIVRRLQEVARSARQARGQVDASRSGRAEDSSPE